MCAKAPLWNLGQEPNNPFYRKRGKTAQQYYDQWVRPPANKTEAWARYHCISAHGILKESGIPHFHRWSGGHYPSPGMLGVAPAFSGRNENANQKLADMGNARGACHSRVLAGGGILKHIRTQDKMEHVHQFGYSFPPIGRLNTDTLIWMQGLMLQKWNTTMGKMITNAFMMKETVIKNFEASTSMKSTTVSKTFDPIAMGWDKRPLDPTPLTGGYVQLACYGGIKFHVNQGDIAGTRDQTLRTDPSLADWARYTLEPVTARWLMGGYKEWAIKLMWPQQDEPWGDLWGKGSDWDKNMTLTWNMSTCKQLFDNGMVSEGCSIIKRNLELLKTMGQENYCNILKRRFWDEGADGITWYRDEDTTMSNALGVNWVTRAWGGFTTGMAKMANDIIVEPVNKVVTAINDKWEEVTSWWQEIKEKFCLGISITVGILIFIALMIALSYAKRMGLPVDAVLRKGWLSLFKIIKITLRLLRELLKLILKLLWKICKGVIIWTMVYERVHQRSPGRLEQRETEGTRVDLLEVTNL